MDNKENEVNDLEEEIKRLEKEIEEIKGSWPVHSVKPQMAIQLEELEDELEDKKKLLAQMKQK